MFWEFSTAILDAALVWLKGQEFLHLEKDVKFLDLAVPCHFRGNSNNGSMRTQSEGQAELHKRVS